MLQPPPLPAGRRLLPPPRRRAQAPPARKRRPLPAKAALGETLQEPGIGALGGPGLAALELGEHDPELGVVTQHRIGLALDQAPKGGDGPRRFLQIQHPDLPDGQQGVVEKLRVVGGAGDRVLPGAQKLLVQQDGVGEPTLAAPQGRGPHPGVVAQSAFGILARDAAIQAHRQLLLAQILGLLEDAGGREGKVVPDSLVLQPVVAGLQQRKQGPLPLALLIALHDASQGVIGRQGLGVVVHHLPPGAQGLIPLAQGGQQPPGALQGPGPLAQPLAHAPRHGPVGGDGLAPLPQLLVHLRHAHGGGGAGRGALVTRARRGGVAPPGRLVAAGALEPLGLLVARRQRRRAAARRHQRGQRHQRDQRDQQSQREPRDQRDPPIGGAPPRGPPPRTLSPRGLLPRGFLPRSFPSERAPPDGARAAARAAARADPLAGRGARAIIGSDKLH